MIAMQAIAVARTMPKMRAIRRRLCPSVSTIDELILSSLQGRSLVLRWRSEVKESVLRSPSTGIRLNLSCDLSLLLGPDLRQVETLLQVQPKLGTRSEITSQTE